MYTAYESLILKYSMYKIFYLKLHWKSINLESFKIFQSQCLTTLKSWSWWNYILSILKSTLFHVLNFWKWKIYMIWLQGQKSKLNYLGIIMKFIQFSVSKNILTFLMNYYNSNLVLRIISLNVPSFSLIFH